MINYLQDLYKEDTILSTDVDYCETSLCEADAFVLLLHKGTSVSSAGFYFIHMNDPDNGIINQQ